MSSPPHGDRDNTLRKISSLKCDCFAFGCAIAHLTAAAVQPQSVQWKCQASSLRALRLLLKDYPEKAGSSQSKTNI